MALTDTEIRKIKPADKAIRLFDGNGLYLEVSPSGGKWWRLKYRYAGKEKRLSLGVYPEVSLKAARERCIDLRKQLANGNDPGEVRKQQKRELVAEVANRFEAVAREWYQKQRHTWVAHHAKDVLRRLEANLFPDLGTRAIANIEAPELLAAIQKIEARGAYDLAHRVLQVSGQVFRYGIACGYCKHDLSADLRGALTPHKGKHQAAIRPEELPALLQAIDGYDTIGDIQTRMALQLLALTFVRTSELIGAQWAEFDLAAGLWIIPAERMKMRTEHVVPLCRQAIAILEALQPLAGNNRYILPGRNQDKPISNNTLLFALYRLGYKGRMTGHGFRSVASTILNEQGYNRDVIERQLAHYERNEIRGAYNRAEYLPARRTMMQEWADYLDTLRTSKSITTLQRKRA